MSKVLNEADPGPCAFGEPRLGFTGPGRAFSAASIRFPSGQWTVDSGQWSRAASAFRRTNSFARVSMMAPDIKLLDLSAIHRRAPCTALQRRLPLRRAVSCFKSISGDEVGDGERGGGRTDRPRNLNFERRRSGRDDSISGASSARLPMGLFRALLPLWRLLVCARTPRIAAPRGAAKQTSLRVPSRPQAKQTSPQGAYPSTQ